MGLTTGWGGPRGRQVGRQVIGRDFCVPGGKGKSPLGAGNPVASVPPKVGSLFSAAFGPPFACQ